MVGPGPICRIEQKMFVREYPAKGNLGTLLFLHGLGSWGPCFSQTATHRDLSQWKKLLPDLPSYGNSPWQHEPVSLKAQAKLLADWLNDRREDPVIVIGHSLGGVLALLLAEHQPTAAKAVINVEGNICLDDCSLSGAVASQSLPEFLETGFEAMADNVHQRGQKEEIYRDFYVSLRMCDPVAFHAHSVELVALSKDEELATRLASLKVPSFYIAGSPGGAGPRSLELLKSAGADCTILSPAGHVPFLEQPDLFAQTIAGMAARADKRQVP